MENPLRFCEKGPVLPRFLTDVKTGAATTGFLRCHELLTGKRTCRSPRHLNLPPMKARNVLATLFLLVLVLTIFLKRRWQEPAAREVFDRHPGRLTLTKHARCRMDCRQISEPEIREIMDKGIINLAKSDLRDKPCPTYAVQGTTGEGESIRVIFAQCADETRVITCYNLHTDFECHCPGDERKKHR
ncbi:MAG: DUF4258 domain-containing protein [Chitinophagaceae bacterium]|nr:MAG: DUF4258 domain-containing protein [Chitinophagaceae bacterium]